MAAIDLEIIWNALHGFRETQIPEGTPEYDEQWDEITTQMAWITETIFGGDINLEALDDNSPMLHLLTQLLEKFCDKQELPHDCAYELRIGPKPLGDEERKWLTAYGELWDLTNDFIPKHPARADKPEHDWYQIARNYFLTDASIHDCARLLICENPKQDVSICDSLVDLAVSCIDALKEKGRITGMNSIEAICLEYEIPLPNEVRVKIEPLDGLSFRWYAYVGGAEYDGTAERPRYERNPWELSWDCALPDSCWEAIEQAVQHELVGK